MNFINFKFFKMHPLLKPYNLFDINGVAILSGFHDIQAIAHYKPGTVNAYIQNYELFGLAVLEITHPQGLKK